MKHDNTILSELTAEEKTLVSAWRKIPIGLKAIIGSLLKEYGLLSDEMKAHLETGKSEAEKAIKQQTEKRIAEINAKWERKIEVFDSLNRRGQKKIYVNSKILADSGYYWENEEAKEWYEQQPTKTEERKEQINNIFQRLNENGKRRAASYFDLITEYSENWSSRKEWIQFHSIGQNANEQTA